MKTHQEDMQTWREKKRMSVCENIYTVNKKRLREDISLPLFFFFAVACGVILVCDRVSVCARVSFSARVGYSIWSEPGETVSLSLTLFIFASSLFPPWVLVM